ncbi:unnamed protein product [Rhizoctonia solani]|uniref:Cytochrome P450 n=1 Tax=Rhizoctonia solani TaxID=456999 RepID=A0A8H3A946_9AGAM|nr:unnamed protein product [Rhizoctonia solani]
MKNLKLTTGSVTSAYLISLGAVLVSYYGIRFWSLWRKAVAACRVAPSWNWRLFDVSKNLRLMFPDYPKRKLGDPHAGFRPYAEAGSTVLATIPLETLKPAIWFSNAEACRQILDLHETRFRKDMKGYELLLFLGPNVVASEGALWKKHRRAVRVSFSEKAYALVWDETGRTLDEWFDAIQSSGGSEIEVDTLTSLSKVTLNIISSVGFGEHFPWNNPVQTESNRLPLSTSVVEAVPLTVLRALLPNWAYRLPFQSFAKAKLAFEEMERNFTEIIKAANADTSDSSHKRGAEQGDILLGLLQANETADDEQRLSDREVLADIYILLLAGHDSTSHTVAFITAIFALYPDIHARVREEADNVWPGAHINPTKRKHSAYKDDFQRLIYTQAVFHEALRHFPPVSVFPRLVGEDTVLPGTKQNTSKSTGYEFSESFSVPLSVGDLVVPDVYALHMNPHYWGANAADFDPTRFLAPDWPKHAFMPFSSGPRACLGRGFATAEASRIIATLAQDWDLECTNELRNIPWESRKEQLLQWRQEVTMTPVNIKLIFKKRPGDT